MRSRSKGFIYTLEDPRTGLVRYVGQTIVKPEDRYAHHIYQWKRCKDRINKVNSWIKNLHSKGLKPKLEVIFEGNIEDLDKAERAYIRLFKAVGADLCNHTEGGGGIRGFKHSEESKNKRLNSLKNSPAWAEKHERHSEIMKAKHKAGLMPNTLKKMKEASSLCVNVVNTQTLSFVKFSSLKEMCVFFKCCEDVVRDFLYDRKRNPIFESWEVVKIKYPGGQK